MSEYDAAMYDRFHQAVRHEVREHSADRYSAGTERSQARVLTLFRSKSSNQFWQALRRGVKSECGSRGRARVS